MVWLATGAAGAVALLAWLLAVPRVHIADEDAPDFATLPTAGRTVAVALVAVAAAQVLHLAPTTVWPLWLPYLGIGTALVAVDALTTWLPRRLHHLMTGAMVPGWLWLAWSDWRLAASCVVGAVAAHAVFHLVWRLGSGFGYGDVRLAGLMGAVAGAGGLDRWLTSILLATIMGAGWGLVHMVLRRRSPAMEAHFPYGPALWLGPIAATALTAG